MSDVMEKRAGEMQGDNPGGMMGDPLYYGAPQKKKGIKPGVIIGISLFLVLVAFFVAVLAFNLFGIRDNAIMPLLQRVPIVNSLLPAQPSDVYSSMSREDLLEMIDGLHAEIETLEQALADERALSRIHDDEYEALLEYRERIDTFDAAKARFDAEVATGDPVAYAEYYSQISEANQLRLYEDVAEQIAIEQEIKDYVSTFQTMEAADAAKILEQLATTDLDLVVDVLKNINRQQRGEIIANMAVDSASNVMKRMAPDEFYQ